jgi:predicted acylesterase/phospholipase RssA
VEEDRVLKLGLGLSGGGSYAIFQLGVLKSITDEKKPGYILDRKVKAITGTSGGAINAVFLAQDNMGLKRLTKFWEENNASLFMKNFTEYYQYHSARLNHLSQNQLCHNDFDNSDFIPGMPYGTESLLSFLPNPFEFLDTSFFSGQKDLNKQLFNQMKFFESFSNAYFPFLNDMGNAPKLEMQRMIRIFLRELLAKHLLPPDKRKEGLACYDRLKTSEGEDEYHMPISVFIGASNVKKCIDHFFTLLSTENAKYLWKFSGERYRYSISIEAMLACATIPHVFPAKRLYSYPLYEAIGYDAEKKNIYPKKTFVNKGHIGIFNEKEEEIDGKEDGTYWDGYFLSNPTLEPLVRLNCVEILLIRLASVEVDAVPKSEDEIMMRKEEIIQNVAAQREIQLIRMHNEDMELFKEYHPDQSRAKYIRVHEIRFSKKDIVDQAINHPEDAKKYVELGKQAGLYFKQVCNNLDKIIDKNHLNLSKQLSEIVITCNYEDESFCLSLRDCITDISYPIKDFEACNKY